MFFTSTILGRKVISLVVNLSSLMYHVYPKTLNGLYRCIYLHLPPNLPEMRGNRSYFQHLDIESYMENNTSFNSRTNMSYVDIKKDITRLYTIHFSERCEMFLVKKKGKFRVFSLQLKVYLPGAPMTSTTRPKHEPKQGS